MRHTLSSQWFDRGSSIDPPRLASGPRGSDPVLEADATASPNPCDAVLASAAPNAILALLPDAACPCNPIKAASPLRLLESERARPPAALCAPYGDAIAASSACSAALATSGAASSPSSSSPCRRSDADSRRPPSWLPGCRTLRPARAGCADAGRHAATSAPAAMRQLRPMRGAGGK
jgi:hypothetical protein